ncbi:MAG TPA: FAD-binding protein, partial [Candidatus Binataceae bacterium]|nr:FAD-binding protein [Candidatus Binataceae bacterium]
LAVHLEDRAFAGSDTLATARALALWLGREAFDLVLLGKYSLDAETGQVGPEIAELLGFTQVTGVCRLEVDGNILRAERESDEGLEEVECSMPAVLTCAERLIKPVGVRPKAREEAKSKPVVAIRAAELAQDTAQFGFAGSPTWVQEVRAQEGPKVNCAMIEAADPLKAAQELLLALEQRNALIPPTDERSRVAIEIREPTPGRDVWVACETNLAGEVTRGSLELLSAADKLVESLGGAVFAIGFPASIAQHASLLASYGADRILVIDHPELNQYAPETVAEAMASVIAERTPFALLLPASERGRDWGPRLAARLKLGLTGDAIGLELDGEGRLVALKPTFGGNIVAPILSKTYPQMATVRSGVMELAEPVAARNATVEIIHPSLHPARSRILKSRSILDPTIVPLEGAEVVVGIGMGVGGPEGIERVKEFARTLNAAVCATRRVTDEGWMPRQLQVGLTGKTIEPRLYFALGISGAPNHLIGIKRAGVVVAINEDPDASIFERADIGLVGDWATLTPAVAQVFRQRHMV